MVRTHQMRLERELESARHSGPFEYAAARLMQRYYRRFPLVHWSKWPDHTSIKDRWYGRGPRACRAARMRLGGASK